MSRGSVCFIRRWEFVAFSRRVCYEPGMENNGFTPQKRIEFIRHLTETGNVTACCLKVGISRMGAYAYRRTHPKFAEVWDDAVEHGYDILEAEARRRAFEGWDEAVFGSLGTGQGSGQVGVVRKYDTTLLIFLLKGGRPEKYMDRLFHRIEDLSKLPDEELLAIVESGKRR